jgi:hypothetical protein
MTAKILAYWFFTTKTDGVVCEVCDMATGLVTVGTTEFTKSTISRYLDISIIIDC